MFAMKFMKFAQKTNRLYGTESMNVNVLTVWLWWWEVVWSPVAELVVAFWRKTAVERKS